MAIRDLFGRSVLVCAVTLACAVAWRGAAAETALPDNFATSMDRAMARMDHEMMAAPSGDPDRDFAAMMIPHHQGAIDMAEAELRFGHDPILRRLAQAIIVEQRQEIAVMRQSLRALPQPSTAANPNMNMRKEH